MDLNERDTQQNTGKVVFFFYFIFFKPDGCDLPSPSVTNRVTRGSRTYTRIGKNKTRGKASCQGNRVLKKKNVNMTSIYQD